MFVLDQKIQVCLPFFRRLRAALDVLETHLSSSCNAAALSDSTRQMLERFLDHGLSQYMSFCVEVLYVPAGCRPDLQRTCVDAFTTVSSFARTEIGTQCR